jgi:hypothetical protein
MFPNGALWRELSVSRDFFYISHEVPWKGASPPCSQKRDPYGKRRRISEPYLTCPSGSLIKEPSFQVSHTELPQNEPFPFQSPPLSVSKSPWSMSPLQVPHRGHYGKICPFPEPFFTYPSGSRGKQPLIQVSLTELP